MRVINPRGTLIDLGQEDADLLLTGITTATNLMREIRRSMDVCDGQAGQPIDREIEASILILDKLQTILAHSADTWRDVIDV